MQRPSTTRNFDAICADFEALWEARRADPADGARGNLVFGHLCYLLYEYLDGYSNPILAKYPGWLWPKLRYDINDPDIGLTGPLPDRPLTGTSPEHLTTKDGVLHIRTEQLYQDLKASYRR